MSYCDQLIQAASSASAIAGAAARVTPQWIANRIIEPPMGNTNAPLFAALSAISAFDWRPRRF